MQHREHLGYLMLRGINIMIDGQFVADGVEFLAKQSVVIERSNEIFHDIALTLGHIRLAHLLLQLVVERSILTIDHLFALLGVGASRGIGRQILIIAPHGTKGIVECRLSLLALVARLEILIRGTRCVCTIHIFLTIGGIILIARPRYLEGRVIIHLGIDTIDELRHWQFYQ